MFLRFTLGTRDPDSGRKQGILTAAHELRDEGRLSTADHETLRVALAWFNKNLNVPSCLEDPENRRGLSWYKPAARKPLQHMWALVEILRAHDIQVEVLKTADPGIVVYEDDWQVVAKPRKGKRTLW